jgi:glycosyltransferase involved in cell wall biosynthesis
LHIALTVGRFDQLGGIERVTVELALGYRALGHEVSILATGWDRAYEDRFQFIKVNAPEKPAWLRTLVLPGQVSRALKREGGFDFIHGQGTSTMHCDLLTFHSVHAAWLEVSMRQDGLYSPRALAKRFYPFHRAAIAMEKRQLAAHKGMIHACSPSVRDEIIHYYGAPPERVTAIPWGIDFDTFRPDVAMRATVRESWGLAPSDTALLLVANEFHRKGLAPIANAMAELNHPSLHLMVAGRGNPEPYRALIQQLGQSDKIHFLGHRDPAPCYQGADLFVMPSTYEGWGLVIGEALGAGLPVVTSQFPGSLEMIQPGQNGLLLDDPRDVQALAGAIATALEPATLQRMRNAARESVSHYAWPDVCRRLLALAT